MRHAKGGRGPRGDARCAARFRRGAVIDAVVEAQNRQIDDGAVEGREVGDGGTGGALDAVADDERWNHCSVYRECGTI